MEKSREEKIELLATKVMGWHRSNRPKEYYGVEWGWYNTGHEYGDGAQGTRIQARPEWNPFESIADAMMVVEKLKYQTKHFMLEWSIVPVQGQRIWACTFEAGTRNFKYGAWGTTTCEAICKAALETLEDK